MDLNKLFEDTSLIIWILSGTMAVTFIIQLSYYLFRYGKVIRHSAGKPRKKNLPVSVVICAKNEAENLKKNLPMFLEQEYPDFEVIVVNDCSSDHTIEVLMDLKVKYPQLHYTTIEQNERFTHGKKLALTVGIKAAKNEQLLLSDADCRPESPLWIETMAKHFSKKKELVIGVGKYEQKKGLLDKLIRFETLFTAMQYLSSALAGHSYMGVGRNLAYKKELFFRHKGFASHLKVLSGDDDLFVKEASDNTNTAVEFGHQSYTLSSQPETFSSWFKQKKRHLSTGKYYRLDTRFNLGLEYISRILFYTSALYFCFLDIWCYAAGIMLFILLITKLITFKLIMNKLHEKDLLLSSLVLDPIMPLILGSIRLSNFFRPRNTTWS